MIRTTVENIKNDLQGYYHSYGNTALIRYFSFGILSENV